MVCKRFMLGAVAAMMLGGTAVGEVLIGPTVHNGSFELLGPVPGAPSVAKATNWDTDPDGDVTYWTDWNATFGGPSTINTDSGTEDDPLPTHATNGTKIAFLQGNNAAFNLTEHVVVAGDAFKYTWDYPLAGRGNITAQLAYQDAGGLIVPITGTASTNVGNAAVQLGLGSMYTVIGGDPAIGRLLAFTIQNVPSTNYPEMDNVLLSANLCAGDVDGNCIVNGADFNIIRDHFRQNVASRELGDLTNDGVVGFPDYLEWRANATAAAAGSFSLDGSSIPEPTGLVLGGIAIGAILVAGSRRNRCCA